MVGIDRGGADATVIVHKPGTRPPDISDIVDTSTDADSADVAELAGDGADSSEPAAVPAEGADPSDAAAATGEPGAEAAAPGEEAATALDLSELPPPVVADAGANRSADVPPTAAAPGLDSRTVEMPAGGIDAFLETEGLSTSPVPPDAPPPPGLDTPNAPPPDVVAESPPPDAAPPPGLETSDPTDAPPPPPGLDLPGAPPRGLDSTAPLDVPPPPDLVEVAGLTDPPAPPVAEAPDPTPPATTDAPADAAGPPDLIDAPEAALPGSEAGPTSGTAPLPDTTEPLPADPGTGGPLPDIADIEGVISGLDDGPVSLDNDPTRVIPMVDPSVPPPPDEPAPQPAPQPSTPLDPADLDLASAGTEGPTVAFDSPPQPPGPAGDDTNPLPLDAPPDPPGAGGPAADHTVVASPPVGSDSADHPHDPSSRPAGTDADADPGVTVAAATAAATVADTEATQVADPIGPGAGIEAEQTTVAPLLPPGFEPQPPDANVVVDPDTGLGAHAGPESAANLDAGPTTVADPNHPGGPDADGPGAGADPGQVVEGTLGPDAEPGTRKRRRGPLVALAVVVALVAAVIGAWLVDSARTDGQVARGTVLGTTPIGGLDADGLNAVADELDADLALTTVELTVDDEVVERNAAELGARIDRDHLNE
ncbi:MAG: hypothetical protein AAFN30_06770, partial [Actinomycetota bacterium]